MSFDWRYKAEVTHIVDGDTIDFMVDLGFGTYKKIRVRLKGVDTNETYGVKKESEEYQLGKEQTHFVEEWLTEHDDEVILQTYEDGKGKYGRWIADVEASGDSLAGDLIAEWPHVEKSYE